MAAHARADDRRPTGGRVSVAEPGADAPTAAPGVRTPAGSRPARSGSRSRAPGDAHHPLRRPVDPVALLPDADQPPQHRPRRRHRRHRRGRRDHRHHQPAASTFRSARSWRRRACSPRYLVAAGRPPAGRLRGRIALGIGVGLVNGAIISYGRINPLITTLATLAIVRGLGYVISGGREMVITDARWLRARHRHGPRHPVSWSSWSATFAVFGWAMPRTLVRTLRLRHRLERPGIAARRRAGRRWRLAFYVTCGGLAALAGLVFVARTGNAQPSAALGIELDVITAVILGGTSLTGGRGRWRARSSACCSSASSTTG